MKKTFVGKKIKIFLSSEKSFSAITGILMNFDDEFFVVDTYKGIEYINIRFIISFIEVKEAN